VIVENMVSLAGLAFFGAYFIAAVHARHNSRFSSADLFGETPGQYSLTKTVY
jgi:hypothetical protein